MSRPGVGALRAPRMLSCAVALLLAACAGGASFGPGEPAARSPRLDGDSAETFEQTLQALNDALPDDGARALLASALVRISLGSGDLRDADRHAQLRARLDGLDYEQVLALAQQYPEPLTPP